MGLLALCAKSVEAAPITIGNPLVPGGFTDSASTTYVAEASFGAGAIGSELQTWSLNANNTGRSITPILLELISGANYARRAIGETQTVGGGISLGVNTAIAFNVQEGSAAITSGNFFFGWKDGGQTSANQGVINFTGTGGFNIRALTGNSSQNLTSADIGASLAFGNNLGARGYAFEATADLPISEPGMLAIFGLGLIGLGLTRRHRIS